MILVAAIAMLIPPSPPPMKLTGNYSFVCEMADADGARTKLELGLRYEKTGDRDGYWWSIAGDSKKYPVNSTYRNMYSYENVWSDKSGLGFGVGGQEYSYALYYSSHETYPSFTYMPDHLVVRKSSSGTRPTEEPVGIGFCRSANPPAQPSGAVK